MACRPFERREGRDTSVCPRGGPAVGARWRRTGRLPSPGDGTGPSGRDDRVRCPPRGRQMRIGRSGPVATGPQRMTTDLEPARDLIGYLDASPSPYHAVATAAALLDGAGFDRHDERATWSSRERGYISRGGTLVAWSAPRDADPATPFRIVGAHTDSPNLRIKPRPDTGRAGYRQLGVEVYGGVLLNSWLDRDLGLSGRVTVRGDHGPVERLLRVDEPMLRVPQLAIHLDRDINERGLQLNRQQHLTPVWGLGRPTEGEFARYLAELAGGDVLAWDVMVHDLTPATVLG